MTLEHINIVRHLLYGLDPLGWDANGSPIYEMEVESEKEIQTKENFPHHNED